MSTDRLDILGSAAAGVNGGLPVILPALPERGDCGVPHLLSRLRHGRHDGVAQIFNLLYRRIAFGKPRELPSITLLSEEELKASGKPVNFDEDVVFAARGHTSRSVTLSVEWRVLNRVIPGPSGLAERAPG